MHSENKSWLQVKGDPSVRSFVFQQSRAESLFDTRSDDVMRIVEELLCMRGIFHAKIHFSSNQLTCWPYNDPYRYRVFVGEEVFEDDFLDRFEKAVPIERPVIPSEEVAGILAVFKRLRFQDESVYLRSASINRMNGIIGMTFSCDGSHYIEYDSFYETVDLLWTSAE